jgi:hypothetical protein
MPLTLKRRRPGGAGGLGGADPGVLEERFAAVVGGEEREADGPAGIIGLDAMAGITIVGAALVGDALNLSVVGELLRVAWARSLVPAAIAARPAASVKSWAR